MDPNEYPSDQPVVALPGVCARVRLPRPPNFLATSTGGQLAIGDLHPEDVPLLGMAMVRNLRDHWHGRMAKRQRMFEDEAQMIGAAVVHPALVERVARATVNANPGEWASFTPEERQQRIEWVGLVIRSFLEEFTHA